MNRAAAAVAVLVAVTWALPALAQTNCPATIAIEERASQLPQGWNARDGSRHPVLIGVTIYEGPPEQNASLVYDGEKKTDDQVIQTWKLAHGVSGYWLACRYSHSKVELIRKLPDSAAQCRVVFARDNSAPDGLGAVKIASCE